MVVLQVWLPWSFQLAVSPRSASDVKSRRAGCHSDDYRITWVSQLHPELSRPIAKGSSQADTHSLAGGGQNMKTELSSGDPFTPTTRDFHKSNQHKQHTRRLSCFDLRGRKLPSETEKGRLEPFFFFLSSHSTALLKTESREFCVWRFCRGFCCKPCLAFMCERSAARTSQADWRRAHLPAGTSGV